MSVPRISKDELKQRLESGNQADAPLLLDVRLKYPYEHSTLKLPGAVRATADTIDTVSLPRDRDIVTYDSDPDEVTSTMTAAHLIRKGYRAVVLEGGIAAWIGANFPVEAKEAPQQAAPQPGALK